MLSGVLPLATWVRASITSSASASTVILALLAASVASSDSPKSRGASQDCSAGRAGLALIGGFSAFAAGRYDDALDQLIDIRDAASAVGGSHAQRDVIDLTLIAAAARAGDRGLARALGSERTARKPAAAASVAQLLAVNSSLAAAPGTAP